MGLGRCGENDFAELAWLLESVVRGWAVREVKSILDDDSIGATGQVNHEVVLNFCCQHGLLLPAARTQRRGTEHATLLHEPPQIDLGLSYAADADNDDPSFGSEGIDVGAEIVA